LCPTTISSYSHDFDSVVTASESSAYLVLRIVCSHEGWPTLCTYGRRHLRHSEPSGALIWLRVRSTVNRSRSRSQISFAEVTTHGRCCTREFGQKSMPVQMHGLSDVSERRRFTLRHTPGVRHTACSPAPPTRRPVALNPGTNHTRILESDRMKIGVILVCAGHIDSECPRAQSRLSRFCQAGAPGVSQSIRSITRCAKTFRIMSASHGSAAAPRAGSGAWGWRDTVRETARYSRFGDIAPLYLQDMRTCVALKNAKYSNMCFCCRRSVAQHAAPVDSVHGRGIHLPAALQTTSPG
jgi:hypothetical protein